MSDGWKDFTDEQRREIGKAFLHDILEMRRHAHQTSIDYGKWSIATLFAVNAAIVVAVRDKLDSTFDGLLIVGMFGGVLLSGATAWINWALIADMYDKSAVPSLAAGIQYHIKPQASIWIKATYYITLLFAVASAGCAVAAVLTILVEDPNAVSSREITHRSRT